MSAVRPSKRTEKLQLMLNDDELQVIEDWRYANRMPTRAAAIRELMRRGLGVTEGQDRLPCASTGEYGVIG